MSVVEKKIWIPGSRGLLGSAIVRRLKNVNCEILEGERCQVDLRNQAETLNHIINIRPDIIILCAATVGGIQANIKFPASYIFDNIAIAQNVIDGAHKADVQRLIFFGSSCMYPRLANQPIQESSLMTGPLEPTNEAYAFSKLAGLALVQSYRRQFGRSYITAVPTNLYGPNDHFGSADSHVVAAMLDRFYEASRLREKATAIWGSGQARREFLFVDDAADAVVFLLENYDDEAPINIAGGEDLTILQLANEVAKVVGYEGGIECDPSKPDGMPLKGLDPSRINKLGWKAKVPFSEGIRKTFHDYLRFVNVDRGNNIDWALLNEADLI
jgi:GDP-L-fucose synthase